MISFTYRRVLSIDDNWMNTWLMTYPQNKKIGRIKLMSPENRVKVIFYKA